MAIEGAQVTELCIFVGVMMLWLSYLIYYFAWPKIRPGEWRVGNVVFVDMWQTAMITRASWTRDMMLKAADAKGEALLAVQQMRNTIVASTVLVMGVSQVIGRLITIMVTQENLDTITRLASRDPIVGSKLWAPSYIRVAVPLGASLLCLLLFGQAVRLSIHLGYAIRVAGVRLEWRNPPFLELEITAMIRRCELYFTLGLRSMYLFIATIFWTLGPTALLVSSSTVLSMLVISDQMWFKLEEKMSTHQKKRDGGSSSAQVSRHYSGHGI